MRPAVPDIPREEIVIAKARIKSQLRRAGPAGYAELVRATRHPAAAVRLLAVPGTRKLQRVSRLLSWCYPLLVLAAPLALLAAASWWLALALVVFLFLLLNAAMTEVNLELGARLLAVNRMLKQERLDGGGREEANGRRAGSKTG